uniref:hypothetical protein n=1 Tax=Thaumasiovibrio occultus TaxID=1891184 RepID=UPI00131CA44A|nr:hypothetical protein [Thaumasiovibrio occultus]
MAIFAPWAQKLSVILLSIGVLAGCAENTYVSKYHRTEISDAVPREKVYVTNPDEHPFYYDVLNASGIYQFVDQQEAETKLTLEGGFNNVMKPMAIEALVLYLIPYVYHQQETLNYSLEHDGVTTPYRHEIWLESRKSVWETFLVPFSSTHEELVAEGLRYNPREERTAPRYFHD